MKTTRFTYTTLTMVAAMALLAGCERMPSNLSEWKSLSGFESMAVATPSSTVAPKIEAVSAAGLDAWLVEDKSQPLFNVQIVFEGAGTSSDPKGREGRAMFAAALLDEGAGDLNALAFQKALDEKAIELSISTDEDALVVSLKSLTSHKQEAFRLLGLALTQPRFDADAIQRKRKTAFSTLAQSEKNPGYILSKKFKELGYPNHPYSRPEIGTKNSLTVLQAADFKAYTNAALAKDNATISVAGDMDAATLAILLDQHLSALPAKAALAVSIPKARLANTGTLEVVEQPIPQSMLVFGTPALDRRDPQFISGFVLNQIIGGDTLTSKLGVAIREQRGLAYSVNTSLNPMSHSATFGGMFATRNEQAKGAYGALLEVATDIRANGVTEEDLLRAKAYLTGSFSRALDTNAALANYLNIMQRYDLGMDYLETRNAKIDAVTLAEVNALATEWMNPERWLVVVVGKPEGLKSGNVLQGAPEALEKPVVDAGVAVEAETPDSETSATPLGKRILSIFTAPATPDAPPAAENNLNTHTAK